MQKNPISVTELNVYIKNKLSQDDFLNNVFVKGEISNFKHHYTGHMYFTLKDENSLVKCIMFKTANANLNFIPKDGMKVLIFGTLSVFERDGVYQIYCKAMKEDGIGDLYKKYEELKLKLEKEGYFSFENKKKIPYMPKTIGILTSQTGSVIRDIINVATRRNPNVHLRLLPVPVQGPGAAEEIVKAIQYMNEMNLADVIIIARGGGSLEDLWPFNEEIVAQAIFNSKLPVISAVGHETDFTIADFVADLRAPTPSAAAELAVADVFELKDKLMSFNKRYKLLLHKKIELMKLRYSSCMKSRAFTNPLQRINDNYVKIDINARNIENIIKHKLKEYEKRAGQIIAKIDALSPLKTLARGYCITEKESKVLRSVNDVKSGDNINIRFTDGSKSATII